MNNSICAEQELRRRTHKLNHEVAALQLNASIARDFGLYTYSGESNQLRESAADYRVRLVPQHRINQLTRQVKYLILNLRDLEETLG